MNTHYRNNIIDQSFAALQGAPAGSGMGLPGSEGHLGVDLAQLIFAPSLAYASDDQQSWGISLLLGAQRFSANGLGIFAGISNAPQQLTNNGHEIVYGAGVRLGWLRQLSDNMNIAASYTSKVYMQKFDDYRGLFAQNGSFDIPAHLTVGLAYHATNQLTLTGDLQRIYYGAIASINNPGPTALELSPGGIANHRKLGASQGIGFAWQNIWVAKLGLRYKADPQWTLYGGLNHGKSPFANGQALINILAPATPETHISIGTSFQWDKTSTWNFSYMHAFNESQTDNNTPLFGSSARIEMQQNSFNVSYQRRL
jgi:long-chain fatty acid transport protein